MDQRILALIVLFLFQEALVMAQSHIKGRLVDQISRAGLSHVLVTIEKEEEKAYTDEGGYFKISSHKGGSAILIFETKGYNRLKFPVNLNVGMTEVDLGPIGLSRQNETDMMDDWVELSQEQVDSHSEDAQNISGILSSGKDLFSRTAAYDFGSNFFRPRFLGSENGRVMLNGVLLNKVSTGRPEWSNWGGLNDALRKQERFARMQSTPYLLGGLSEGINMISMSSERRAGSKLSISLSNKNYQGRIMATFTSELSENGWSYMLSGSWRSAGEGYRTGTNYMAYSFLGSIDKQFGKRHSLNATLIYALNKRGKSSPMTREVFELKDAAYNSYWGYQQGEKRNSREKCIREPILQLNHLFKISEKTKIHNHLTYQFGSIANGRLDYSGSRFLKNSQTISGGGMNPDPSYYQKLPSYFLRNSSNPDYAAAFYAEKEFRENGQIKWEELYGANTNADKGSNSIYVLYDDQQERNFWSFKSDFSTNLNEHFSLYGSVSAARYHSEHYAFMKDLLGGGGYLDVDRFADDFLKAQSDLQHINRVVKEKEKFRYNYILSTRDVRAYLLSRYGSKRTDAFIGIEIASTSYQRNGLYENGAYPGQLSFGKSKVASFFLPGIKTGISHRFSGRHVLLANVNYLHQAPLLDHSFSNVRVSNDLVRQLKPQIFTGFDMNYVWRHTHFNVSISAYYLMQQDQTKVSFYYADGLTGLENAESSAYVQEVLTGIDRQNTGIEFSFELPVLMNFKLKAVIALGSSVYTSDPDLYLTSNAFDEPLELGKSFLSGYYATGGPQHAISLGFEYSSPKFWWLSSSLNYFNNSYIAVAPIMRSKNFFLDTDGLPIYHPDMDLAKALLIQESLEPYMNLNLVGGKSWKVKDWYFGFFASINNLLNSVYRTGGFEQSRNANYNTLKEDRSRSKPLFGPKYWYAYGTTFFTSFYIRL